MSAAAIWSRDPSDYPQLPEYLLTADGHERDWLAWLVTFAPGIRPFTAFCRVISFSSFIRLSDAFHAPELGQLENACIGLVLGEALSAETVLSRAREPLTASACASVLSFALVREFAIYDYAVRDEDAVQRQWSRVRQLTRQRERSLDSKEIAAVADVLGALIKAGPSQGAASPVLRACHEIMERSEVFLEPDVFGPTFEHAAREMGGTREERVAVFERAIAAPTVCGTREAAFAIGYLASRINPGTLAHASLVAPALQRHPAAMLWYGVCAGMAEGTSVLGEFGGVGRRVLREVSAAENFVGRSRADISALELEIRLGGERADDFPVYSPSQLTVELVPGVSTVVNWSSRARSRRTPEGSERSEERAWLEAELGVTISRLTELQRRVHRGDSAERDPELDPDEAGLFDRSPNRRPRKR
jgi:hypothetical protein